MRIFRILLLILLSAVSAAGQSSYFKFRHYTINEGLAESMVLSILQDSKGFMWFGSNGLSRFDGYRFTNFTNHADDPQSLVNNKVQTLFEDSKGQIWIGTRAGLSIFNRKKENFTSVFPDSFNTRINISCFNEDEEGFIYIGTTGNGLIKFNPMTKTWQTFNFNNEDKNSLPSNSVSKIIISKEYGFWISTDKGLCSFDRKTGRFTRFKRTDYSNPDWAKDAITSIEFDKHGFLWIGSRFGITRFSPATKEYKDFTVQSTSKGKNLNLEVSAIRFVNGYELWIGTQNGIVVLDTHSGASELIQHRENDLESLGENEIEDIYLDKTNNLWIATRAAGVDKLKFHKEQFYHYKNSYTAYKNLSSNGIYGMVEDKDDNIWLATLNGLNKFFPKTETFRSYLKKDYPGITNDLMWSVYTDRKYKNDLIWVGTDAGMFAFSISQNKTVNPFKNKSIIDSLKSERIMAIAIIDNNLWLGSENGVININFTTEKIRRFKHLPQDKNSLSNPYVWRLRVDSKKNLWVCTTNGLNCLKPGTDKFIVYQHIKDDPFSINNNEICEIFEDSNGIYWVGTSDGLNKFDFQNGKFYKIDTQFPLENIFSIQKDNSGALWMGTMKGLIKYNPADGSVLVYNSEDGIQSNEFNFPSLISSTGEFYFTGVNGLTTFFPEEIKLNNYIPPVYITRFWVMNKAVKTGDLYNGRILFNESIADTKEVTLNYDENIVSLEFAALDFRSPQKNQYSYYMENYESTWNPVGNRRIVTYKLDPGTYIFRVKGSNSDNVWNEKGTKLIIHIRPPWWNTIWFKIIIGFIVLALLYIFLRQRTKNLIKQKAQLEILVGERTSELYKQQDIVREQAERIQHANLELEQLNSELENRVIERTAELELAKVRAEKADKIKSEFLAQMSHEIRSPINVLLSFSNLIRSEVEDKVDPDLKEGFKSISNAGKRIIRTVDLLLNMAEIQTDTFEYIPAPLDLVKDILDIVLPEYYFSAREKSISLLIENNAGNTRLIGDHYTLEQIFANLIDNAIKYTNTGEVVIRTRNNEAGELICEILDSGIGMSREFMERLFIPFSQEEQGYTRKYEGNGLGLALVKKYCELNDIDLSVSSTKGKGSTFTLRFLKTVLLNSNK